jgi:hypothetical protein
MDTTQPQPHSQLFTVRMWSEDVGSDQREWRGKVEHVASGEVHHFRDWPSLIALLVAMLPDGVPVDHLVPNIGSERRGMPS